MIRTKRLARIWEIILFLDIFSCRQRGIGVFTVDYLLKIKKNLQGCHDIGTKEIRTGLRNPHSIGFHHLP